MTRDHSLALVYFCALAAVGALPCLATAQVGTGPLSPMGGVLCGLLGMVYGNFGRALITLAVVSLGVGALLGKVSWGLAIMIAVGVGLIFGAPTIARAFLTSSGSTGVIGCCVTGDGPCGP